MTELIKTGPLLARRSVLPTDTFVSWVAGNGGPHDERTWLEWDPHVTVMWSAAKDGRWPVDGTWAGGWTNLLVGGCWLANAPGWVPTYQHRPWAFHQLRGGVLGLALDGQANVGVLHLEHDELKDLGHRFDFPSYKPHITLWHKPWRAPLPPMYLGHIVLGPLTFKVPKRFRTKSDITTSQA